MKNNILAFVMVFSGIAFCQNNTDFVPHNLIIQLSPEAYNTAHIQLEQHSFGIPVLDGLGVSLGISKIESIGQHSKTQTFLLVFNQQVLLPEAIQQYRNTNLVVFAEPNYRAHAAGVKGNDEAVTTTPNDTYFASRQWGLFNNGTFTVSGMPYTSVNDADSDMELAWDIQTGNPNMIIAVPDTGIRLTHNDIAARIWNKSALEPVDGLDNDGNGLVDDYQGWDYVNSDNNPTDDYGHGTNCSGIIGAIPNNNAGYAGVNWNSKIMALKVLDNANSGTYAAMANSIYYAVDNGAKVISMSIGGSSASTALSNALTYANTNDVTFVACMMNFNNDVTYYPAGYASSIPNVIAVGSTNSNDERTNPFFWSATSGSNYGNHISVVAPGNYIWGLDYTSNSGYNSYWGGTSQATPLVAGIASLLKAQNPALAPAQIKTIIQNTAQDQIGDPSEDVAGWDEYMGWGRVNAFAALQQVLAMDSFGTASLEVKLINPVKENKLKLDVAAELCGRYSLTVYSYEGEKINSFEADLQQGTNALPFDFAGGNYLLEVKGETFSKIFKVVKQ